MWCGHILAHSHRDGICMLAKRPQTTGREKIQRERDSLILDRSVREDLLFFS